MMRSMCKSKIHGAIVTEANLNYVGSLSIDRDLLDAADIIPYEWLHVVNVTTGSRFETYAIEAEAGSGTISLNGAAARLGHPGDKLIIMCATILSPEEITNFAPRIVFVDAQNKILTPAVGERGWNMVTKMEGTELVEDVLPGASAPNGTGAIEENPIMNRGVSQRPSQPATPGAKEASQPSDADLAETIYDE